VIEVNDRIRIAVPSDGAMHEPTLSFLEDCGLSVNRGNSRRYIASIPSLDGVTILFQRSADITSKVEDGSADLGILGYDRFVEMRREDGSSGVVMNGLGFGRCALVVGVPDSWVDVVTMADLADVAMEFRDEGKYLRVATKSPRLVERFLVSSGINYFSLVQSSGTLEASPAMGFADIIADITSSGNTMRENHLKTLHGGTVIRSEACLIGNVRTIKANSSKQNLSRAFVDTIAAHLQSKDYYTVTANINGDDPSEVSRRLLEQTELVGLRGPTIAKVYADGNENWYALTLVIQRSQLMNAVNKLRDIGGTSVTVSQPSYVFQTGSDMIATFLGD